MIEEDYRPIVTVRGIFAKCPTWILGEAPGEIDEADNVDVALLPRFSKEIVEARSRMLARLDSLQAVLPQDAWLVGQRVRFRAEFSDEAAAVRVLESCQAERWWCDALRGYAEHRRGENSADSLLLSAVAQMPDAMRCDWNDIGPLLDENGRSAVRKLSCAARDSVAARFFWLADPLLSDAVNERRAEHYARRVQLALHGALAIDERHRWPADRGSDAVAEMMVRYGWPSAALWTGTADDSGHDGYVGRAASPYSTAEYSLGRVHYAPSWRAVVNPSSSRVEDWQLHSPLGVWGLGDGTGRYWWPQEHIRERSRVVAQLPAPGQLAFLPRHGGVRVLSAMDLANESDPLVMRLRTSAVRVRSSVTTASGPTRYLSEVISDAKLPLAERHVSDGMMATRGELFGVEVELLPSDAERRLSASSEDSASGTAVRAVSLVGRTRFGIAPVMPLDSLVRGAISVSHPVLFTPGADRVLPVNADELSQSMLATTTLPARSAVGVYWEHYGLRAGDSLRVSINLIPASTPGLLRRAATAVRLLDPVSSVTVQWAEPSRSSQSGAGEDDLAAVSVRPRSIVLDLSSLRPGDYWVELVASAGAARTATSRRSITIR